jgi:stage IV sporulation protein FB
MSDLLTWSPIPLGRWFGTTVRVHVSLLALIALTLLESPFRGGPRGPLAGVVEASAWLALFLLALAVHEGGHALAAWATECEMEEVHLWPLGSLTRPSEPPRDLNYMLSVMAGPFASGMAALTSAAALGVFWDCQFAWYPLGRDADPGAPWLHGTTKVAAMTAPWLVGWFGFVNYWLFLANLLPAPPFDGGRLFRWFLANASPGPTRDGLAAPWTARAVAAILFLVGLVRVLLGGRLDGFALIGLALLVELMVRSEARIREDGGYFDDTLFGYDFSEGYTSLEGGAAKVRPYRESALTRWRRRRSDLRRQRRIMREVAEERRMDEILDKLHREGKAALTDEEHRFLVRVSRRFRGRQKTQD